MAKTNKKGHFVLLMIILKQWIEYYYLFFYLYQLFHTHFYIIVDFSNSNDYNECDDGDYD